MPTTLAPAEVTHARSLDDAVHQLAGLGEDGEALAGGTWIMRAPLWGSSPSPRYVALNGIEELHDVSLGDRIELGALLTHTQLARIDGGPAFAGIREAAHRSAFPQVRNVATLAGNLGAIGFAEADLVPALLAAEGQLHLYAPDGAGEESMDAYLDSRNRRPAGELIARVAVPAPPYRRSAFERLTVRAAGEYAVVNVAVSVDVDGDVVRQARIAVGSVEPVAKLCPAAADVLVGTRVGELEAADAAGHAAVAEVEPRDGFDAPGWYRLDVLPVLIRRALSRLRNAS